MGSSLPTEGRLEVYTSSGWATVCDDQFDYIEAGVVCNSLGYKLVMFSMTFSLKSKPDDVSKLDITQFV